jgi:hypothetical protein
MIIVISKAKRVDDLYHHISRSLVAALSLSHNQKRNIMVTEAQQKALIEECNQWYEQLATYREKLNQLKTELYYFAPGKTKQETLIGIEHFHNQFHIQLINIHDLKHEIRHHVIEAERHPNFGHRIPHHHIKDKLDFLLADLDKLETDFHQFIQS